MSKQKFTLQCEGCGSIIRTDHPTHILQCQNCTPALIKSDYYKPIMTKKEFNVFTKLLKRMQK